MTIIDPMPFMGIDSGFRKVAVTKADKWDGQDAQPIIEVTTINN